MPRHAPGHMANDRPTDTPVDAPDDSSVGQPVAADWNRCKAGRMLLLRAVLPLAHISSPSPFGGMDEAYILRHASFDARNERRVARALLLHGLRLLGVDADDLRFQLLALGKPDLPLARFSFSYADAPCCLVSREASSLGLDCLSLRDDFLPSPGFFKDGWRMEKGMRAVASRERPPGDNLCDNAAMRRLKIRWTLRRLTMVEAIGKAQGSGLACMKDVELGEPFRRMGVCSLKGELFAWRTLSLAGTCMTMAVDEDHADLLRKVEVITLNRQDFA